MIIDNNKMMPLHGYFEGSAEAVDKASSQKAILYKKEVCKNYINLSSDQIDFRLGGSDFHVTRKYDGEMNVLFYEDDQAALINRSGRIRTGLPCIEDAKNALKAAGIKQAVLPAELYVNEETGRTRVFHVLAALGDEEKIDTLRLAMFDILELDHVLFQANSYGETYQKINDIFAGAKRCNPVICRKCSAKSQVKEIYAEWVEEEGAEGLVVRTDMPLVYKIKPRYTIDVAVVGYSEGTGESKGQARSLLLAMMPCPGEYQIIGKTGNGFSDEDKRELLKKLEPLTIDSEYIETDSNHVAFHMIKPDIVIELMINDVLMENATGPLRNAVLTLKEDKYVCAGNVRGLSVIFPIFQRFRQDKQAVYEDIRLEQINEFSYIDTVANQGKTEEWPPSQLLKRQVYKKESGTKLMVQKFVVWETNKPGGDYPGYVFHYTNFSSERKEPLQREVIISDDLEQILDLYERNISENIKKGWTLVG